MRQILLILLSLFIINPAMAVNEKKVVRVALSNQTFSAFEHYETKISSKDLIKLIDMSNNTPLDDVEANKTVMINMTDNLFNIYIDDEMKYEKLSGPILLNSNSNLEILGLNRKGDPAQYMGMIELKKSQSQNAFNIINVIDIQNYLRGVVSNEMPVSFGLEALKAQSVAARNYAQNANMSPNYDLVDSTAAQVYYGANSYRDISDKAVNQTQGIYALYNSKPITALYFSTSPGITDDWDDVFGDGIQTNVHPYLKPRFDKENQKPLKTEEDVIKFYSNKDGGIDTNSPKYRWNYEFTRKELEEVLNKTLLEQSKTGLVTPLYTADDKIEGLKEIKALKRTASGKITELEIIAKSGKYKIKKELTIRRTIKKNNAMLPSANFYVETSGEEYLIPEQEEKQKEENNKEEIKVKENKEEVKLKDKIELSSDKKEVKEIIKLAPLAPFKDKYPSSFKFIGGGFGHGVGMSQFGAYNLAKEGKKYPEILKHYYTNISLATLPKEVFFNEYNVWYKTEFYYDKNAFKAIYLVIDNRKNASEFPFMINDFEFSQTAEIANNKLVKINITKYLKDGVNTVNFAPLSKENKGKIVTYRLEML